MKHEYKSTPVKGVLVNDEGDGIVTALVSITGIKDNVNDVIEPGSYGRTLKARNPKGIWHHTWTDPIAKTLDAKELLPGDDDLPKKLADGSPWPKEAGALRIKMQFNLDTPEGKKAYSNVKFFDDEQEWSIGYNVPATGSRKDAKTGIRYITDIDLFEYSPVLFGAMSHARTVKDLLEAEGKSLAEFMKELKAEMGTESQQGDEVTDLTDDTFDDDGDDGLDSFADEEFEDDEDESTKGVNPNTLRKAINALGDLLAELDGAEDREPPSEDSTDEKRVPIAYVEVKAAEYTTITEALDSMDEDVPDLLAASSTIFDDAWLAGNKAAMDKAGSMVLDQMDAWELEGEKSYILPVLGQVMSDMYAGLGALEGEGKSFTASGVEYKMGVSATRQLGWPVPVNGVAVGRKTAQDALLSAMDDDDLIDLVDYLEGAKADRSMLRAANRVMEQRREAETKSAADDSGPKVIFDLSELKGLDLTGLDVSTK